MALKNLKYTREILQEAANSSTNYSELARKVTGKDFVHGGLIDHIKKRCIFYGINVDHFERNFNELTKKAWLNRKRRTSNEILVLYSDGACRQPAHLLRRSLQENGIETICSSCGITDTWNGKFIQLEIDHIDGNYLNCLLDNLRYMCPNCHSQTETYKSRNK